MRIHHLQHVPFEGLGTMDSYFLERGHQLGSTHFYLGNPLPCVAEFDWLIVMGGPMGVYDELEFPWLKAEKSIIQESRLCYRQSCHRSAIPPRNDLRIGCGADSKLWCGVGWIEICTIGSRNTV